MRTIKKKAIIHQERKGVKEVFQKFGLIDSSSGLRFICQGKGAPTCTKARIREQHGGLRKLLRAIRDGKATEWV